MWGKPFPVAWVADGETEAGLVSGMTLTHCTERLPGSCGICSRINRHVNEPLCIFIGTILPAGI